MRKHLAVAILLAWALLMIFGRLADRLILWPQTDPIDAHGAARRALPFAGGTLEAWIAGPADAGAFVLRFYGNADRAERWTTAEAAAFAGRRVQVWGVNYPGYGGSTGPATLQRIADASLVAFDALAREAAGRPIYVFGTSLGTTAALRVAAARPVAGLMLQNPPALRQLIVGEYGWWNLWLLAGPIALEVPRGLDSVANAARVRCPAVFLLADRDEVVPHKYHLRVAGAYAGEKEILIQRGAGHNTTLSPDDERALHRALDALFAKQARP
jgi:uncharacterized protein